LQCVVLHADFVADYSFVIRSILNYLCIFYLIRIYVFFWVLAYRFYYF
jgi:hypothetical protein